MKPSQTPARTGILFSRLARRKGRASAAAEVWSPLTISSSFIIWAGAKKCRPRKRSGAPDALARSVDVQIGGVGGKNGVGGQGGLQGGKDRALDLHALEGRLDGQIGGGQTGRSRRQRTGGYESAAASAMAPRSTPWTISLSTLASARVWAASSVSISAPTDRDAAGHRQCRPPSCRPRPRSARDRLAGTGKALPRDPARARQRRRGAGRAPDPTLRRSRKLRRSRTRPLSSGWCAAAATRSMAMWGAF